MYRTSRWIGALAIVLGAGLPLAACAQVPSTTPKTVEPFKSEAVGDTKFKKLTLTDQAVQRLGLDTAPVTEERTVAGTGRTKTEAVKLLMPYSALLYLPDGTTFAYTNPDGHSYVREPVAVESIRGDQVVLTTGPKPGTTVVTTGGAELWGAEFGIK